MKLYCNGVNVAMSLFDEVKCSYNIGELTNVLCQSKNIDDWGGTMAFYWVNPAGYLYSRCYAGTYDFVEIDGRLPGVNYLNAKPNGKRARFKLINMTRCIEIYNITTSPDCLPEITTCYLEFYQGRLMDYMYK